MKIDGKREFALLDKIGFVRTAGSDEETKAAKILMEEIASMGVTPEYESFEIDDADCIEAELEVLAPYSKKYKVTAYKLSESTPAGGIEAPFYYAENATAADIANMKGKIVLVNAM